MILSLVNVKGGVGKTTTAVNLAAAFARSDLKVLLIDLDPQGSASFSLGVTSDRARPSTYDLLVERQQAQATVWETGVAGLELIPGSIELAGADLALARRQQPEKTLATAIAPLVKAYDVVVIDCPPGLSVLTVNALTASTGFIVPVVPHELAVEAVDRFFDGWQEKAGGARLVGLLLTMVDHRTLTTADAVARLRKAYGSRVFRTEIPINVRLAEAPGAGLTIFDYQSWSPGAAAYGQLGAEVIRRCRKSGLL